MRVTDNMRFNTTVYNLFNSQSQYNDIMEKLASQKNVNRASDDPVAATKILTIRQGQAANEQYRKNMDSCDSWLSATESSLSGAYDLLVNAQEIAIGQATATANDTTRKIAAQNVQSLIEEMASLANAKLGDRYLFAGTQNGTEPFSTSLISSSIMAAEAAPENGFTGTVTSSGTYTGTSNNTYVVKVTGEGALAASTYQFSTDGGRTWNGTDLSMAGGSFNLGDGVTLSFNDGGGTKAFSGGDIFTVNAVAAGFYRGNSEDLSVTINRGINLTYNISGAEAFTSSGSNSVDVFATLNALRDALNNNDAQGISNQINNLKDAQNQVTLNESQCGTKSNHIDVVRNNLTDLDDKLSAMLSDAQDADLTELATRLSMKEVALKASYVIASKIGDISILDYLR
jgi:flagellar hook-associated protein 3 FlgL